MLNSQIELKNMLFKDKLVKISCMFPKTRITYPADSLTKLYKDPISFINSLIYRFGPKSFGSRDALEENVVATCQSGAFNFMDYKQNSSQMVQQSP